MTALSISIAFLGLLAFLAYREWLKRQDFEARFQSELAQVQEEIGEAVKEAVAEGAQGLRSEVVTLASRVGRIEAFAGIGEVQN